MNFIFHFPFPMSLAEEFRALATTDLNDRIAFHLQKMPDLLRSQPSINRQYRVLQFDDDFPRDLFDPDQGSDQGIDALIRWAQNQGLRAVKEIQHRCSYNETCEESRCQVTGIQFHFQ
jgi:hypothetical protein